MVGFKIEAVPNSMPKECFLLRGCTELGLATAIKPDTMRKRVGTVRQLQTQ